MINKCSYTENDVLLKLDDVCYPNPYKFFPQFDSPISYPITSRINLYGDENRWAIVFELTTYNTNGYNIGIEKCYFGNCVNYKEMSKGSPMETNNAFTQILSELDLLKIMDEMGYIKKDASSIMIRGKKIILEHNLAAYTTKGIKGYDFQMASSKIDIVACFRFIQENNPNLFHSTDLELKKFIPKDLPKIVTIDKWHHKNYQSFGNKFVGEKPSSYETFQQIAKVLVTKNKELYTPTLVPNNDWRNWPNAGHY
jgi:hypothetical protein